MSLRTRLAFIAILLLIGWVLVAPHYRASGTSANTDKEEISPPLLQLRRGPLQSDGSAQSRPTYATKTGERGRETGIDFKSSLPANQRGSGSNTLPVSINANAQSIEPTTSRRAPEPGLVPRSVAYPAPTDPPISPLAQPRPSGSLKPTPIGRPKDTLAEMKPVRLIGNEIGRPVVGQRPGARTLDAGRDQVSNQAGRGVHSYAPRSVEVGHRAGSFRAPPNRTQPFARLQAVDEQPRPGSIDRESRPVRSRWHRVVDGDTLESISREYLGSPEFALLIFEANRHTLVSPTILPLGAELRIPGGDKVTK